MDGSVLVPTGGRDKYYLQGASFLGIHGEDQLYMLQGPDDVLLLVTARRLDLKLDLLALLQLPV